MDRSAPTAIGCGRKSGLIAVAKSGHRHRTVIAKSTTNMSKTSDRPRKDPVENRTDGLPGASPPSHYVAVGASAGGLEAIEAFFSHMPPTAPGFRGDPASLARL